jgi:hypothetical protein
LVATANDLLSHCDFDLGGLNLAFLVFASLATTHNLLGRGPHVNCHFLSPSFWLQLLMTLLVIMILILVV